jgi:predicted glutamine amidotransferase
MIVYYAGVPGGGTSGDCRRERELVPFWKHRLWTFYWMFKDNGSMKKDKSIKLFLDSGAFSAWTQGKDINLVKYIKFIKKYRKYIDIYANLDVIGMGGNQPNAVTAEATLKNQRSMEKHGLNPLPVFHFGEPMKYLDYYIAHYDYISLGIAGNLPKRLVPWLDDCFQNHICDKDGMPKIKIHGFAVTSLQLMVRYPWYSVDSTSWVVMGRNGKIIVPRRKNNTWMYDENSFKISVSNKSPDLKVSGQHYLTLSKGQQQIIDLYLEEKGYKLGKSEFKTVSADYELQENERWFDKKKDIKDNKRQVEIIIEPGLSNKYMLRDELNIIYFQDLENYLPEWPWPFEQVVKCNKLF